MASPATLTMPADSKLVHLVGRLTTGNSSPNVDHIVNLLRTQHREYQRKDVGRLTAEVAQVLAQQQQSSRKRKSDEEKAEAEYDRAAEEYDRQRAPLGGGGLNASLRVEYRRQVEEREAEEPRMVVSVTEDTEEKIIKTPSSGKPPLGSTGSSNNKSLKRKTSKLRRSSSSNLMGDAASAPPAFLSPAARPTERYIDLGGMDAVIEELRRLVEYPIVRPELYRHLGVDPPRGVLLRGPPGVGKTFLANAVAGQLGVPFFRVSAPEIVSGMSGESEGRIRDLFQAASDTAPSLIFLDELDAIAPKRSDAAGSRGMEKRMVAQLLTCMDMIAPPHNRNHAPVIVLAATNRPDALDPALRRAGRFDKEILMGVPDEEARERILRTMTKSMRLDGRLDFKVLARKTPGFVGADVQSLAKEAAVLAINRIFCDVLGEQQNFSSTGDDDEVKSLASNALASVTALTEQQMEPLFVTMEDFLNAIPLVQPSSKREGFATVPDVSWDDIGALHTIREELTMSVLEPIRNPEKFKALGLSLPAGVLLYGPPGCGKTLVAKAVANESGANFISVKGPELLDKYVGESERAVRLVFERARASSPCIVFFDELDSLVPRRGSDSGGGGVSERVVNQLLTELDGLESRRSVFVIAATNRPELIDPAMLRPGRLDKLLYVPLPTPEDRASILKALATNVALGPDVNLDEVGKSPRAHGYSGADCAALVREAGLAVLKEDATCHSGGNAFTENLCISSRHFDRAFDSVMPSVSKKDQARYDRIRDRMARARSRVEVGDVNVESTNEERAFDDTEPARVR